MPDYIKKARKCERRGEYLRAAELFVLAGEHEHAIDLFVQENLFLKAAKICERIGRSADAAKYFSKIGDYKHAADLLNRSGDFFNSGLMYRRAQMFREAAKSFEKAGVVSEAARMFELDNNYRDAAERYLKANMVRSAAICYEKAAHAENPTLNPYRQAEGRTTPYKNLIKKAAQAWAKVPDLNRSAKLMTDIKDWKSAGKLYERAGKPDNALTCYNKGKFIDEAIRLLKRLNRYDEATKLVAKKTESSGDPLQAAKLADSENNFSLAAEYYERAGQYAPAAERYEKIGDYLLAAEMYFRSKSPKKAAEMYEMAGNIETAAKLYDDLNIIDKAISLYTRKKNYIRAAELYLKINETDEAIRLLLRIPKNNPSYCLSKPLLGICYFRNRKIETGIEYVKQLLIEPISKETIRVRYEYARALYEDGQIDGAIKNFREIVNFDKKYEEALKYLNLLAAMREEISAGISDTVVGELPVGLVINERYELLELMGKGGMGIVYRAADRELNLAVALKILRPKFSYDPEFIEMIKREVTIARMLAHPNIIKIYDLNRAGHIWFLSMDFLYGEELKEKIEREGALPIPIARKILLQVLDALQHSHDNHMVHSDIKPHNIFIDQNDHITLVDFGIARAAGSRSDDGMVTGTPEYVAPEQIQGEPATVQSDLYSLGVTLYETVTGEMAFNGNDINTILDDQLNLMPPEPKTLRSTIPNWLNYVIVKCIQKNPNDRYHTAQEILKDVPGEF